MGRLLKNDYIALAKTRLGLMAYNVHDAYVGRSLEAYGQWAWSEMQLLGRFLPRGGVAVDVGANIGTHTVFFARKVGQQGQVVALEPLRLSFQLLCTNVTLNALSGVDCRQVAAGAEPGRVHVPSQDPRRPQNFAASQVDRRPGREAVDRIRLDDLDLPCCDLIKIDVEGMEVDVLAGAGDLIARHKPVLYVENDRVEHSRAVIEAVQALGYRAWWHIHSLFDPDNANGNPENVWGDFSPQANMLCLPASVDVQGMVPVAGPDETWIDVFERLTGTTYPHR